MAINRVRGGSSSFYHIRIFLIETLVPGAIHCHRYDPETSIAFQLPSTLSILLGEPENVDAKRYTHQTSNNQRPSATPYISRPNGPIIQESTSQSTQHIGSR